MLALISGWKIQLRNKYSVSYSALLFGSQRNLLIIFTNNGVTNVSLIWIQTVWQWRYSWKIFSKKLVLKKNQQTFLSLGTALIGTGHYARDWRQNMQSYPVGKELNLDCIFQQSMKVVSLCNQLSRSIQLRRKQSSDTLDSKSDEVRSESHTYPLCTNGFFPLVWYNKLGMVHCIFWGVTGYSFKMIFSVFLSGKMLFCLSKQCRPWWNATFCGISSGSSLFAKIFLKGSTVQKGLRNNVYPKYLYQLNATFCGISSLPRFFFRVL